MVQCNGTSAQNKTFREDLALAIIVERPAPVLVRLTPPKTPYHLQLL
jgi:hypothetical protein